MMLADQLERLLKAREGAEEEAGPDLLHLYFEQQVACRSDHTAVECSGESFTYSELDRAANRIAHGLRARGVAPGSLVGLYLEKSCGLFAAVLGILKAGAGYVPIDPRWPAARIESIVDDAKIEIVLSEGSLRQGLATGSAATVILLDGPADEFAEYPDVPLPASTTSVTTVDTCYVIYTSGSTGKPKGVVIEHRNAVNFVRALRDVYRLTRDDRIYQGFSLAFDASVEEIWAAFSLGGTLVVPPDCIGRSPSDAAEFITSEGLTYFSTVPTFLSMIDHDLPTVRLLVLGGEACSQELVERWSPGRRLLNTYGPTEATVVATAADCIAGKRVSIGSALPGYTTHVLDEQLSPVAPGDIGELFIGGASIARGYINRPELNKERFVADSSQTECPFGARLYRTHDLVRLAEDGSLEFCGRIDSLVKIRGFRVELTEIEAVLAQHPTLRAAAVTVVERGGLQELAAYVVPGSRLRHSDRGSLVNLLRERLPDYMIPKYLEEMDELPTMTSGKVDRSLLPAPQTLLSNAARERVRPACPAERMLVEAFESCTGVSPIFVNDDFFRDIGGHSLLAARVVTELRTRFAGVGITVRDMYEQRTIRRLSEHLGLAGLVTSPPLVPGEHAACDVDRGEASDVRMLGRWACAFAQAMVLVIYYGVLVAPLVLLCMITTDVFNGDVEWWAAVETATTAAVLVWPSWLLTSIAVKWVVIGRYRPGRYRVWGVYYLRWWIANRFQALSWSGMFVGTPLMALYYRAMGATVGSDCTIATPHCTAFDLITIGDNVSVGVETQILAYRIEDGWLKLDRVRIGDGSFVGMHCNLGLNTAMDAGACLDDMSLLADGEVIGPGESRQGSPSKPLTVMLPPRLNRGRTPRRRNFIFGLIHLALIYLMGYLLILSALPGLALTAYAFYSEGAVAGAASVFIAVPLAGMCFLLIVIAIKNLVIGPIKPGFYPLESFTYLRLWFLSYLMDNLRYILTPVYATMVLPFILRLLGARIGRGVEISTVLHVIPDLVEIGDDSFLADACLIGGMRINRGWVEVATTSIGSRTFVGNSALIPAGKDLGNNCLIGVMSVPPRGRRTADGSRWLGSPSFELPNTEQSANINEDRTYRPPVRLVLLRAIMESVRIILPTVIIAANLVAFVYLIVATYEELSDPAVLALAGCYAIVLSYLTVAMVAWLKSLLIGTFRPTVKPLWSTYVWSNEIINSAYESTAANAIAPMMGTPFIAPCLRLMGCKIGRWVFLETTLFSEFDLVEIGDMAALNIGATVQTHLFEDRIMKVDSLRVGDRCSIGNMSTILYGSTMQKGSRLGPMSLLMKGETLMAVSSCQGIPSEPVRNQPVRNAIDIQAELAFA